MKKLLVLLIAIAIAAMPAAFADNFVASPKLKTEMFQIETNGEQLTVDFVLEIPEMDEDTQMLFTAITESLKLEPAIMVFGSETFAAAAEFIPEGVLPTDYSLVEIEPIRTMNYLEGFGDISATFKFAPEYPDDSVLLALLGAPDAENPETIAYIPLQATPVKGCVRITFTQEALKRMQNGDAFIAILQA